MTIKNFTNGFVNFKLFSINLIENKIKKHPTITNDDIMKAITN